MSYSPRQGLAVPSPKRLLQRIWVVAAVLFIVAFFGAAETQPTIVIASAFEPPLSNPQQTGMIDILVKEVFRKIGRQAEIVSLPAERSLISANSGLVDGDLLRIGGLNRLYSDLVQVPEPSMDFEFVCFTRRVTGNIVGWKGLEPYNVAIVTGWKILEENVHAEVVTKVDGLESLMALLDSDRVDIVIYERIEGCAMIERLGVEGIHVIEPPIAVREMYLYLNRKHEELLPEIAATMKEMKRDGSYEMLEKSHLIPLRRRVESWSD